MNTLKHLITASLLLLLPLTNKAQNIYTIAGNGNAGYSGDGLSATSMYCELNSPDGICIDAAGNLYISDGNNNVIREINTSGIITTFAGSHTLGAGFSGDNGPATDAQLNYSLGVCADTRGNIYIADQENNAIRMVNTSGIITTIAGIGIGGFSGDTGPATAAELNKPWAVYVDVNNNILISDVLNWRIRKINTSGIISTFAGNGISGYSGDGGFADTTEIGHPIGISGNSGGDIYFADAVQPNSRIRKINTSGIISTVAGNKNEGYTSDGGLADTTELFLPYDVYVNKNGDIYISDTYNQRVRKIDNSGIISTIAGIGYLNGAFTGDGGPATDAELSYPWGIAVDAVGNVYFADNNNQRIRKISIPAGVDKIQDLSGIDIYPNPVSQLLKVNFTRLYPEQVNLTIMDITGREVLNSQRSIGNYQLSIDVSFLSSGMYFLGIKNKNSYVTRKFIKQ